MRCYKQNVTAVSNTNYYYTRDVDEIFPLSMYIEYLNKIRNKYNYFITIAGSRVLPGPNLISVTDTDTDSDDECQCYIIICTIYYNIL